MTKRETLDNIIYDLRMSGYVDFEVDDESYRVDQLENGGYCVESEHRYFEVRNLTSLRKEITKLGRELLWL